jgi:uncharacterized protein (UPF0261 family)
LPPASFKPSSKLAVALVVTLDTKAEEAGFLVRALEQRGLGVTVVDIGLGAEGVIWRGERKLARMAEVTSRASAELAAMVAAGVSAVVGMGGGTGGEMVLALMQNQPIDLPQVLVTTLPFDPRSALASAGIILVPTLADIAGLNHTLRQTLERTATIVAALAAQAASASVPTPQAGVAITVLGATQGAADGIAAGLRSAGHEPTLFHANGYGGAAYARMASEGRFSALVDATPHELTRIMLGGAHVAMPERFNIAVERAMPVLLLPGALNFIGLGAVKDVPSELLKRPHYAHSTHFTHVKVSPEEMALLARALAAALAPSTAPVVVLVPMGGFSHQDAPGGVLEDEALRRVFLETMNALLGPGMVLKALDSHINHPATAAHALAELAEFHI